MSTPIKCADAICESFRLILAKAGVEYDPTASRETIAQWIQQVVDASPDKARLDWMQRHACEEGRTMAMPRYAYRVRQWQGDPGPNIRSAIDGAMKEHEDAHRECQLGENFP